MKRFIVASLLISFANFGNAQSVVNVMPPDPTVAVFSWTQFLLSLLAGFILAVGFQFLLTTLSVAAGVTALSRVTAPNRSPQIGTNGSSSRNAISDSVQKINNGFGLWSMITASVALFFACWLGVELSFTESTMAGAILGLVVWGLFYLVLTSLEATAISSLTGALFRTAASGLRSSFQGLTSMFAKSPEEKLAESAKDITAAVRREIFGDIEGDDLRSLINKYIDKVSAAKLDPAQIRKEISKLLDDTEIEAVSAEGNWDKVVASFRTKPIMNAEKAKSYAGALKDAFSAIREEASGNKTAKVADAALRAYGLSPQEAQAVKQKVGDYLRKTGKEQLQPEAIKHDFEMLLSDPKAGKEALKGKLAQIDKSTIATLLSERKDLSREEAERMVERVNEVIQQLNRSLGGGEQNQGSIRERAIRKIENYLSSLDRPELKFDDLDQDIHRLFSDPKAELNDLLNRAKRMDRDTLKALLSSKKNISEEDADRMIQRIEDARDKFVQKSDQLKMEVERRVNEAKRKTLEAAEESRKIAATAAWWVVGTAVVSGIFSVLGGIVAVATGGGA